MSTNYEMGRAKQGEGTKALGAGTTFRGRKNGRSAWTPKSKTWQEFAAGIGN